MDLPEIDLKGEKVLIAFTWLKIMGSCECSSEPLGSVKVK
jgi:hypothetical protein